MLSTNNNNESGLPHEINSDGSYVAVTMPNKDEVRPVKGTRSKQIKNGQVAPDKMEKTKEEPKKDVPPVGIFAVFQFASCLDVVLLLVGTLAAVIQGSALPMSLLFFGQVIDAFIDTNSLNISSINISSLPFDPYNPPSNICAAEFVDLLPEGFANPFEVIQTLVRYYLILGGVVFIVAFLESSCWNLAAEHQVHRIRILYFRKILGKDIEWFDKNKGGELTTRISDDIDKILSGIGDKVALFIQSISTCVAGITIGFIRSWQLCLVIVGMSAILLIPVIGISGILIKRFSKEALDAYAEAGNIAEEVFSAIRTVVAFGGEKEELRRYTKKLHKAKQTGIKKATTEGTSGGGLFFVIYCSYAAAFGFGTYLVLNVDLSPGSIIIAFFSVLVGAFSLAQAGPNLADFNSARGAAAAIYKVIEEVPTINCLSNKGVEIQNFIGRISFEDVKFCYPSRADVQVLDGLNLEVNVGQTVALVGSSGCGKSTTIQLIQRFYDPNEGIIKLDGVDLRDLNVKWLRENIGIVSQEPVLFATTIAENIRYGRLDVAIEDIHQAAKEANAFEFIQDLPEKFNTLVGERGAQLSGGQKQRIAIARALVRNPKILLLDEATSALDTESEGVVQAALEKVSAGRTTVVIAHRLSTIKNADMICAFKDGVIVERGTHSDLMSIKDGIYQGLVHKQQTKEFPEEDEKVSEMELEVQDNKVLDEVETVDPQDVPNNGTIKKKEIERTFSQVYLKQREKDEDLKKKENDETTKKYFKWSRILNMNSPEWHYMILGTIGSAVSGGVQPSFAILFSQVLKAFGGPEDELPGKMVVFCCIFVGIGVASLCAQFCQGFGFGKSGEELTMRLRHQMFKAILRQEISWFDDHANSTGALTTRLATEASLVQGVTGVRFGLLAEVFFNIVVAIIISFVHSWQLTLLILAFLPLIGLAGLLRWSVIKRGSDVSKKKQEESGQVVAEAVDNIRTVQALTREMKFHKNYRTSLKLTHRKALIQAVLGGLAFSFAQGIIYFAYASAFTLGGHLVEICALEFDGVFLVISAIIFGAFGLGRALAYTPDYSKAKTATARMFKLIDQVPLIDVYDTSGQKPDSYNATVSFQDVRFNYPTRPDVEVLQGLTVMVGPGETLALVGSSGCGKSTSVALAERFYDPLSGQVLLDSYDSTSLNLSWLRQQMSLVSQEPMLFDRTISENIAYGDNSRKVSQDEVEAAARKANIHDFVISLPEGYKTNVGNKGTQLSGGQKQRIAIARALVRNPKILLLDEATSALDTESEKVVQEALDEAKKGRTCITIAHRLSTIHDAEKIAIIRQGKVAEFGTHDELMQLKEQYYSLYTSQSLAT